jgi:hypothetical protein
MWKDWSIKPEHEIMLVRFEVFTAVIRKNAVFCDVALCRSCANRRFGGTQRLNLRGRKIREQGTIVSRWLQTEPPVENTQLCKNREGEWVTWEINREERGRVCRDQVGRPGEQVADRGIQNR